MSVVAALIFSLAACTSGGGDDSSGDDGTPSSDACSVLGLTSLRSTQQLRVINGTRCSESNSPVVQVITVTASENFLCSGSFISPTAVLTAAHCFLNKNIVRILVVSNGQSLASTATVHPLAEIVGGGTANYDVAIVKVAAQPNLPTLPILVSKSIEEDDIFSIFGYGLDENGVKQKLRSGQGRVSAVDDQHITAVYTGEGSDSCGGDSGGPALISIQKDGLTQSGIVGLVSSGSSICGIGDVALYANTTTSAVLDFIQAQAPDANLL
jgi:secreted trypsin-like serine protease